MPLDPVAAISVLRVLLDRKLPDWRKQEIALREAVIESTAQALAEHHIFVARWSDGQFQ